MQQTPQQAIVQAFKASQATDRAELAVDILQDIFQPHAFDLKQFLQKYTFTHAQRDRFISYLLYGLYYNEIAPPQANELLFLTLTAEVIEEQDYKKILQTLPLQLRFQLMAYCLLQPREGAWYIMEYFEELFQQDAQWLEFIQLLKTYYYSPQYLQTHTDLPFDELVLGLKQLAHSQIQQIHKLLPELIDLIITAPRRGAQLIAELKRQLTGEAAEEEIDQATLQAEKNMQSLLQKYQSISYTVEEYARFFKLFGLQNHYLNTPITTDLQASLSTVLERIKDIFLEPIHTPIEHINSLVLLIERICHELYAFTKEPAIYAKGLQNLVYTVATRSSHFTKLPWLPSVLKGLQCLSQHCQGVSIDQCPIIIFDQSNQELFNQNKVYIQSLSNQYQAIIWHLSTEQTLSLAKKWGLDHWFAEPREGAFGYASSRNCLFYSLQSFIAPLNKGP